jgi:hypothetical protein
MPISDNAKLYVRGIIFVLLGVMVTVLGIVAVGFFSDYFTAHPALAAVAVSNSLGLDLLGAVAPLMAAIISFALFVKATSFPIWKFAVTFLASAVLAFLLFHPSSGGVEGFSLLYALGVGAVAVAANVFPKLQVDYRKIVASTLLALACVPLSRFAVDFFYSQGYVGSVIGGNGLADALLVCTLYAPLAVTAAFSVLAYVSRTVWLVGKSRDVASTQLRSRINTGVSGDAKNVS